jgi:glycosyltransferase involved in cell wall biosynthesis
VATLPLAANNAARGTAVDAHRTARDLCRFTHSLGKDATSIMNGPSRPSAVDGLCTDARLLHVLVMRAVDGTGGGADQIILRSAQYADSQACRMALCFLRNERDEQFDFDRRCQQLGLEYHEVRHRGALDWSVSARLRQIAHRVQPHLIHAHDYKASFFATRLAQELQVPRLATAHGWTGNTWRERFVYYPADRRQLRGFTSVIAVSDEIQQTLIRSGCQPNRVRVLLNAIDPREYQRDEQVRVAMRQTLGIDPASIVIGACGRLERQKRFDVLLDAFAIIARTHPELRLVIAGEGTLQAMLQQQIDRQDLRSQVTLLGHCPDMRSTYQAFDLLVQSSDYEGTPTVIVEAMALELPIVATDVGGTAQLAPAPTCALLVPPRAPHLLADAILRTLGDTDATATRVAAARERVETTLNYAARTRKLESIYRELCGQGSRDHGRQGQCDSSR